MKKTFAIILIIALVLIAASLCLRGVAKNNAQKEHIFLMETLLPDGKNFVKVPYSEEDSLIKSVHKAQNGYVIETVTNGYADEITVAVGVNNDGFVTGLVTLDAHETAGLGSKILTDREFLAQFLNKSGSFSIGSNETDADSWATETVETADEEIYVDGISGATVSSKAVAKCVSAAVAYVTGADVVSSATTWEG